MNILAFAKVEAFLKQITYLFMIPFFSIPLWLAQVVMNKLSGYNTIGGEQWFYIANDGVMVQYSNNFTLLRWVFPQTIPVWIMIIVFLLNKEKIEHYIFILLPGLLFGTLAFIGIVPLALATAIEDLLRTRKFKEWLFRILSWENVLMLISLGSVLFFYFIGNVMGEKPADVGFKRMPYTKQTAVVYFSFVLINVLPYALLLFKKHKKEGLYYTTIMSLFVFPLFRMGLWNDFTMRASIPALFMLMLFVIDNLFERIKNSEKGVLSRLTAILSIVLLLIGMYYPFNEMSGAIRAEFDKDTFEFGWGTLEGYANREATAPDDVKYNYYTYDIDENFFCRHIMR